MRRNPELDMARCYDPGRNDFFCDTDRNGVPLPIPPVSREPVRDRETNPRGVRHIDKTRQDHMPVSVRPRVQEAKRLHELRRNMGQG